MPEKVLFETEMNVERAEIASYLRTVADRLDAGEPVRLSAGGDSVSLDPPKRPTFEVKAEREGPDEGPGEMSIEFEIEWPEGSDADGGSDQGLTIE